MSNWLLQHVTAVTPQLDQALDVGGIEYLAYTLTLDQACEKGSLLVYARDHITFDDLHSARYVLCTSDAREPPVPLQFFKVKLTERALIGFGDEPDTVLPLEILDEESGCLEKLSLDDEGQPLCLVSTHPDGSIERRNYQFDYASGRSVLTDYSRHDPQQTLVASMTFPPSKFEFGTDDRATVEKKDYKFLCELFELTTRSNDLLLF